MTDDDNSKPIPRSILIFGAAAHIGGPLARFLGKKAPDIKRRLVSSSPERAEGLRRAFPDAEVVSADYLDLPSLERAVQDMEGIFVVTPATMEERPAMTNLVTAAKKAGTAVHILRCLGVQPEANMRRIPDSVRNSPFRFPIEHAIAKQILDESDLPVTYLNFGAAFLDNFLWVRDPLVRERKLVWHNRLIPFIDPRDIAEVAGRLLLSDNHRHIGQFHTLNNGHDLMRFDEVADLMSEVFGEKITYDGTKQTFFNAYSDVPPQIQQARWDFFEYERENEVVWALNDFVERMLGRKPVKVRAWLEEHKHALLT